VLDLEISAPDTVRLVPVYLGLSDSAVFQADASNTFALSPPTSAIALAKSSEFPNGSTNREGLGMRDVSNDLEVHRAPICCRLTPPSAAPRARGNRSAQRWRVRWKA
jgi:hypothetical protein